MKTEDSTKILVFKTSVNNRKQVKSIELHLKNLEYVYRWNFALDDRDRILRIVTSENISVSRIVKIINSLGFNCIELE
ncbi:MAG: hypothetical protein EBR30_12765 [Cytophagia bacterium]|nr:hypothetical protein [Cytophagia bacterium]